MKTMQTDEQIKANLAANVKRLLLDRKMGQRELARKCGEPEMTISRVVRAENLVNAATVSRIAEAFDVSIDRLLGPPPEENLQIFSKTG